MKLVIDIPNGIYDIIQADEMISREQLAVLQMHILNGTPLPKGHGRLIDADKLEYTCNSDECGMLLGCNHCQYNIITEEEIDSAPTIIEADKGESEPQEISDRNMKMWEEIYAEEKRRESEDELGEWLDHQNSTWIYAKCSKCESVHDVKSKYCPTCGAKMKMEGDDDLS